MLFLAVCFLLSPAVFALNDETKHLEIEVVDFEKELSLDNAFQNSFDFDLKILESLGLDQLQPMQETQLIKFEINSENEILLNKRLTNSKKTLKLKNLKAINSKLSLMRIDPVFQK